MALWSKKNILHFIELYHKNECLWNFKSKDYTNKLKRDKAYESLVDYVRTFYYDANKDTVTSKISNLRNAWRKQNKKRNLANLSGDHTEEASVYEPSLYYFDKLKFISDSADVSWTGKDSNDTDESQIANTKEEQFQVLSSDGDSQEEQSIDNEPVMYRPAPSISPIPLSHEIKRERKKPTPKGRKRCHEDDLLFKIGQKFNSKRQKDDFAVFGETVANDLRTMSREQFLHAKKIISDVLYEGNFDNLSRTSCLVTTSEVSHGPCQCTNFKDDIPATSSSLHDEQYSDAREVGYADTNIRL